MSKSISDRYGGHLVMPSGPRGTMVEDMTQFIGEEDGLFPALQLNDRLYTDVFARLIKLGSRAKIGKDLKYQAVLGQLDEEIERLRRCGVSLANAYGTNVRREY